MQVDFEKREVTVKLVYYGPALSGKTTNLQQLHDRMPPPSRGRLMTLDTRDDRTLFFDLLPLTLVAERGLTLRFKVFTVPGQPIHTATRRLVLSNADGVAFVADSQLTEARSNAASFLDLRKNLAENGKDIEQTPVVVQFNKRDLPQIRSDEELVTLAQRGREPLFKAIATRGIGVVETFLGLVELTWDALEASSQLGRRFGVQTSALMDRIRPLVQGAPYGAR